jgi:Zn-dependent protease with chaperone function
VVILLVLGAVSLIMFEPVTTIATLLKSNEPPRALIGQALPITALFTIGSAGLLTVLYRPGLVGRLAILMTTLVIVLFLGLNISILGLVVVPKSSLYVVGEVVALIVALALVYSVSMAYVWRVALQSPDRAV